MRIFIDETTLGVCARRRVLDISRLKQSLVGQGHELINSPVWADRVYLFTCGFNRPKESASIATIQQLVPQYGDRLVTAGCLPTMSPSAVKAVFAGTCLTIPSLRNLPGHPRGRKDIAACWGCQGKCSYCADRRAVGPLRSRPLSDCLADLRLGLELGLSSFRLVGDDLGAWGQDIGLDFTHLLAALTNLEASPASRGYALHLLEMNAQWLVRYRSRLDIFSSSSISSLMVGIQSASDRILGLMRRDYTRAQADSVIARLRQLGKRICAHFMVGFPSESERECRETLEFITDSGIDSGFVFLYSDMEGTPAYFLHPKVENPPSRLTLSKELLEARGYDVGLEGTGKLVFTRRRADPIQPA